METSLDFITYFFFDFKKLEGRNSCELYQLHIPGFNEAKANNK